MTDLGFDTFFNYTINQETNTCQIQSLIPIAKKQNTIILPSHFKGFPVYPPDNCTRLFETCKAQTIDLSNIIDTSNITSMAWMFADCHSLTTLNLSSFNTSNVINMSFMLKDCKSLTELDLSNFDTTKVEDVFDLLSKLPKSPGMNAPIYKTDMSVIFEGCDSLTTTNNPKLDDFLPNHNQSKAKRHNNYVNTI